MKLFFTCSVINTDDNSDLCCIHTGSDTKRRRACEKWLLITTPCLKKRPTFDLL